MGTATSEISLVLPPGADALIECAAEVFRQRVEERSGSRVVLGKGDGLRVSLDVDSSIGPEGFRIEDADGGAVRIAGGDPRGLLYGVGKLLRTSRYGSEGFVPGTWRGESVPVKPVRGIYFASHFHNFYHAAPIDKVRRYVRELALWGTNALQVWFDMHHFAGIDDPAAQAMLDRLAAILEAGQGVGMRTGIVMLANEGYAGSPEQWRAVRPTNPGRGGFYETELCPAQPGARDLMLKGFAEELDAFDRRGVRLDHIWIWPYDQGGCDCPQCRPWGANGFLKMAEAIARMAKGRLPDLKVMLSTWLFDNAGVDCGEWRGMAEAFRDGCDWADYVLADYYEDFPRHPLEQGVPGGLPLVNFPEISMWGMKPWGGLGATPQPDRFQRLWEQVKHAVSGGFPYSEGIFEDITKAVVSQFYWDPDTSAEQTVREYVAYEFSPDVVEEVWRAIRILEANHRYAHWYPKDVIDPEPEMEDAGAAEAHALLKGAEARLPEAVRTSWRWRILLLRALVDEQRYGNRGVPTEACEAAFEELTRIYHAQGALRIVAPPTREAIRANRRDW